MRKETKKDAENKLKRNTEKPKVMDIFISQATVLLLLYAIIICYLLDFIALTFFVFASDKIFRYSSVSIPKRTTLPSLLQ